MHNHYVLFYSFLYVIIEISSMSSETGKCYKMIGMMSGTSLDGIDLCYCRYYCETPISNRWKYELIHAQTSPYSNQLKQLLISITDSSIGYLKFRQMQLKYSEYIVEKLREFIQSIIKNNAVAQKLSIQSGRKIIMRSIDGCCLHGHTVFHEPGKELTVQIANLSYIAAKMQMDVIGNFRQLDVHRGGQGAPLAPYGQEIFQCSDNSWFLNLGGIANISFGQQGHDIAFCNLVINKLSEMIDLSEYDCDGHLGRQGIIQEAYLHEIKMKMVFKGSLAREQIQPYLHEIELKHQQNQTKQYFLNILRTYYEFLAQKIIQEIQQLITPHFKEPKQVICTGGGAMNKLLIQLLQQKSQCKGLMKFRLAQQSLIEFKQAIIFGFLGVKYLERLKNCASGTGGMLVKGRVENGQ